jgi:ParB/RepB/Spo0J family partition protein
MNNVLSLVEVNNYRVYKELPLEYLVASPYNERVKFEGISELAEDIKGSYIVEPLLVHKIAKNRYEIINGHRRYKALIQLQYNDLIPCIVYERRLSEDELTEIRRSTDIHHSSWPPYDRAKLAAKYYGEGMNNDEILIKMNCSKEELKSYVFASSLSKSLIQYAANNNVPIRYIRFIFEQVATKETCKRLEIQRSDCIKFLIDKWIAKSITSSSKVRIDGKKISYLEKEDALYWLKRENHGLEVLNAMVQEKGIIQNVGIINKAITSINKSAGQFNKQIKEFPPIDSITSEQFERINDMHKTVIREYKNFIARLKKNVDE